MTYGTEAQFRRRAAKKPANARVTCPECIGGDMCLRCAIEVYQWIESLPGVHVGYMATRQESAALEMGR